MHTLLQVLASSRWVHEDGELVVASEVANPELRSVLANQAASVKSRTANRESGKGAENREQPGENPYSLLPTPYSSRERSESPHFAVYSHDDSIVVLHRLEPAAIDNDLAELVAGELVHPGHVAVPRAFERCFAGVVLSSAPSAGDAWRAFYGNTLSRLEQVELGSNDRGPVAVFGRIYEHARGLVTGSSLLDVGTCFGFFPLLVQRSEPHLDIAAVDVSAPTLELARDAASEQRAGIVEFVHGDARGLPFADGSFDTVTALHVLEHLSPSSANRALQEMCRVARRRVVVAVPLEEEPDPAYGHVQSFDPKSLTDLGEQTGWRCGFDDYLGGWIVVEPPS